MPADLAAPPTEDDLPWMRIALELARQGLGLTSPNPPVGAVIVKNGRLLGAGWHQKAGGPHAEIAAIGDALQRQTAAELKGATLYVTLEPCSTQGKTGPCTGAILEKKFGRVVVGTMDPNPAHSGAGIERLRGEKIPVSTGCCESESRRLIRYFAKHITTGRPYTIAKTAITLDGRTVLRPEEGPWITGEAAREDVQRLRREMDAILVGGETVRRDDPRLTLRGEFAAGRPQPWRVVLSASRDLPASARLLTDEHKERTPIFHGDSLDHTLASLGEKGVTSVLIESGGRLFAHALAGDLLDEVVLYIAPILGGGAKRLLPVDQIVADLEDVTCEAVGRDWRVSGIPKRR